MKKLTTITLAAAFCVSTAAIAQDGAKSNEAKSEKKETKHDAKKVAKVEKTKVPKEVMDVWVEEYPIVMYDDWYGYPTINEYVPTWFYDWDDYDYDPYVHTEYPEYYVVDFTKDNIPYKAVYNKKGKKIATHKKLTSDLPKVVSEAISKGEYKDWKIENDKEEIFKDKDSDQLKVYKVKVEKGKEEHVLYFQSDGKLLKDKNCHK